MQEAIEKLSGETGFDWKSAAIRKLEYGCNVEANATTIYRSLQSYKGKDYLPMLHKGRVYGAACDFTDYRVKGYDKTLQVKMADRLSLDRSLFRWEVALRRPRCIERTLQVPELSLQKLLMPKTWQMLAEDATNKYQNTTKKQQLHFHKLTPHENRIYAEMLMPEVVDNLKRHHKETYKRDRRIYKRIMADSGICLPDDVAEQLSGKFGQLISNGGIR
jgi:hypothetical protein